MSFVLPFTTPPSTEIFTVEDSVAQLIWRGLPTGDLTVLRHDGDSTSETRVGTVGPIGAAEIAATVSPEQIFTAQESANSLSHTAHHCVGTRTAEAGLDGIRRYIC